MTKSKTDKHLTLSYKKTISKSDLHPLNPLTPFKVEISLPHCQAIFSKLKNEDKDLFFF